jgi:hypothetical protein
MAFCNSCGAPLNPGAQACAKCGGAVTGTIPAAAHPAPPRGNNALKTVLIVVAAIMALGILCVGAAIVVAVHIARTSHMRQEGDKVKVDTPFGTFSANDPEQAVAELGVDIYPGAEAQKDGAAAITIAGIHTVTANFESHDSVDRVCDFYKSKFPNSTVTSSDNRRCTTANTNHGNSISINVVSSGGGAKFHIANVTRKSSSSDPLVPSPPSPPGKDTE